MTLQNFGISSTPLPSNPNLKEKYGTDMKCPRVITNHTNQRPQENIAFEVEGNFFHCGSFLTNIFPCGILFIWRVLVKGLFMLEWMGPVIQVDTN